MRRPTATKAKREQQAILEDEINNHHNHNNKEEKENNLAECKHEKKLAPKKPKMRVIKPCEKFRFEFEWENTENILEEEDIEEEEENNLAECEKKVGSKKPKMRVIKPSEKFRFTFEWEETEDVLEDIETEDMLEDINILYHNPDEAQRLFGRGFRGRMDRYEQEKLAAKNFKEMHDQIKNKDDSIGGEAFNENINDLFI